MWGAKCQVLVVLAASTAVSAFAPSFRITDYIHESWTREDGLPAATVHAITQTQDGYLWLGTEVGLVRFDGVRFTHFSSRNEPSFTNDVVDALLSDRDGGLWVGTRDGLLRYESGHFIELEISEEIGERSVVNLFQSRDGQVWASVGTRHRACVLRNGRLVPYLDSPRARESTGGQQIFETRSGDVWAAAGELVRLRGSDAPVDSRPRGYMSLAEDAAGALWLGTSGHGLFRMVDGVVTPAGLEALEGIVIGELLADSDGYLWLGTLGRGLGRLDGSELTWLNDGHDLVTSMFVDRAGSLWFSTSGGGLQRLRRGSFVTRSVDDGLGDPNVLSIYEDRAGGLWFGTNAGVDYVSPEGNLRHFGSEDGLTSEAVLAVGEDATGRIWLGTASGGLQVVDGDRIVPFASPAIGRLAPSIQLGSDSRLRVGTAHGLVRLEEGDAVPIDGPRHLVTTFIEDRRGTLWVGDFGGLHRVADGRAEEVTADGDPLGGVLALHEDEDGAIWVGTYGKGLLRWSDGTLDTFDTGDGLAEDVVFAVLPDDHGHLWLSGNSGVTRVARSDLESLASGASEQLSVRTYGRLDGLRAGECTGGGPHVALRSRDGRLWFATPDGVAVVDPDDLPRHERPPMVLIESLVCDGRAYDPRVHATLPPGTERCEIRYTATHQTTPQRTRFRYHMERVESDWVPAGRSRVASYTSLAPGPYEFRVTASNENGVWNEEGARLVFHVDPFFYQTAWFYALVALATILAGVGVHRLVLRRRLEVERVRTRIAADLHDDIGAGLTQISILSEVARRSDAPGSETAHHLARIADTSRELVDSMSDIVWTVDPRRDTVADLVRRMARYANETLEARGIETSLIGFDEIPTLHLGTNERRQLYLVFKESVNNIAKHAGASRAEVRLRVDTRRLRLEVIDDGVGFDRDLASEGNGLVSMRRRASELGGHLELASGPGAGCRVTLSLPWRRATLLGGSPSK